LFDKPEAAEPAEATSDHEALHKPAQTAQAAADHRATSLQQSAVVGFELVTTGANQVPDTPHPEISNVDNLGFVDTPNGGYLVLNVKVTFREGVDVAEYKHVRTAVILGSNEIRSGDDENPSKNQTRVDGQVRFVYDNPGVGISGVPKAGLGGKTFAMIFVAGELNKKTGEIDSNVMFYGIKIAFGKDGKIDRANSGSGRISRDDFIKLTGIKNPEKMLKW
jgi:hypothetical protein